MVENLKQRTAHSLKWNIIDRVSTQVLYAITGIVLARVINQEDFGLVGACLIFQAFASLLVDSGFSYALLQRKEPTRLDYSSVLWFNILIAVGLYAILYFCAPLIAWFFKGDVRLIPLSRVMFLSLIINASTIVQVNRLMKIMDVRMVAISNFAGLVIGGTVGIYMAVDGYGAWAIVGQTLIMGVCKSLTLWISSRWIPLMKMSWQSLKSFFGLGSRMMLTSFLNTIFLNIYGFLIGNRIGLVSLGYYTQADKWSKMGITSLSQVLTSTFVPTLSAVQDDPERYKRLVRKMNRFTAYLLFPCMIGLIVMAEPIFHVLFGQKWDPSICLFQLLLLRGIFVVLNSLYTNYLLALGRGRQILRLEVLRDCMAVVALVITFPYMAMTLPNNPVYGLTILLWGQFAATLLTWVVTLVITIRVVGVTVFSFLCDLFPYLVLTTIASILAVIVGALMQTDLLLLVVEALVGVGIYLLTNYLLGSKIQIEVWSFLKKSLSLNKSKE